MQLINAQLAQSPMLSPYLLYSVAAPLEGHDDEQAVEVRTALYEYAETLAVIRELPEHAGSLDDQQLMPLLPPEDSPLRKVLDEFFKIPPDEGGDNVQ